MATYTTNFNLAKPEQNEAVDVDVLNSNSDIIDDNLGQAKQLALNIGYGYNNAVPYFVGDYCVYQNKLYKCIQNILTPEDFDETKWQQCTLGGELQNIKGNTDDNVTDILVKLKIGEKVYKICDFANENLANEYSALSTYSVGDYVIYEDDLYKCISNVSTAEPFDSNKWTECLITDEMGSGGGGGGGNKNIVSQETPSILEGNENDLYFKTGGIVGYYHYVVSTVSTSSSDAIIQVQETNASGSIVETTTFHHESSGDWTEFDGHFKVHYDFNSYNWVIEILDDNIEGYESGDVISWHYDETKEYDLKTPVLDNSKVTNQYIKINNDWVEYNKNNIVHLTQAEYDALPNTKLSDNKIYMVEDVTSKEVEGEVYSTEEHIVGKWIDGSPIYQKTIYYAGGTSGGMYLIPHGISGISEVIQCDGICHDSDGDNPFMVIPRIAPDNANIGVAAINNTEIIVAYSTIWQSRLVDLYMNIKYTKFTT